MDSDEDDLIIEAELEEADIDQALGAEPRPDQPADNNNRRWLLLAIIAAVVIIFAAIILLSGREEPEPAQNPRPGAASIPGSQKITVIDNNSSPSAPGSSSANSAASVEQQLDRIVDLLEDGDITAATLANEQKLATELGQQLGIKIVVSPERHQKNFAVRKIDRQEIIVFPPQAWEEKVPYQLANIPESN